METATDDDDKGGSSSGGFSFSPPKPPSAGGDGGDKKHKKDKKKKHKKEKAGGDADARKGPMVDAFMKAIEAQRAEAKRAKLAARLRPTVWTDWRDEFAIEWKACPLPTAHEHFCIEAAAAPWGSASVVPPYARAANAEAAAALALLLWADTNFDALSSQVHVKFRAARGGGRVRPAGARGARRRDRAAGRRGGARRGGGARAWEESGEGWAAGGGEYAGWPPPPQQGGAWPAQAPPGYAPPPGAGRTPPSRRARHARRPVIAAWRR